MKTFAEKLTYIFYLHKHFPIKKLEVIDYKNINLEYSDQKTNVGLYQYNVEYEATFYMFYNLIFRRSLIK